MTYLLMGLFTAKASPTEYRDRRLVVLLRGEHVWGRVPFARGHTWAKYSFSFLPLKSVSCSSMRALAAASGLLKFILTLLKLLNN